MKIISIPLLISLFCFCSISKTFADSPLTSTPFYTAYNDDPIIILASKTKGLLTKELLTYLLADKPVEKKMALINALGWDLYGKTNTDTFLNYVYESKGYHNKMDFLKSGKPDEIICLAYIKALDNYFNVDTAIYYADCALQKNQKSYTFNIITALIKAQKAMSGDWCKVYSLTDNVRGNKNLEIDIKQESIDVIFKYMDSYKNDCK